MSQYLAYTRGGKLILKPLQGGPGGGGGGGGGGEYRLKLCVTTAQKQYSFQFVLALSKILRVLNYVIFRHSIFITTSVYIYLVINQLLLFTGVSFLSLSSLVQHSIDGQLKLTHVRFMHLLLLLGLERGRGEGGGRERERDGYKNGNPVPPLISP